MAFYHCFLNLIPLLGAIVILILRSIHFCIGRHPVDSTILQFVAKFHELPMQVSIVEATLCVVRLEATNSFVPLGALSGAVQATQLPYLWSLDFLSLFTLTWTPGRKWHRVAMVNAIPVLLGLTALVGPSIATLMIPEPGLPKVYEAVPRYYQSKEIMYPTRLKLVDELNM